VSRFLENAQKIFQAAEEAAQAGLQPSEMTIFIGPAGGIQMIAGSDWPLESLTWARGAQMAYRVSNQGHTVKVEGRAGGRTCLFEAETPNGAARHLLSNRAAYTVTPAPRALLA
jgi:hypothetical protein